MVMDASSPRASLRTSGLISPGVLPYIPLRYPLVSLVIMEYFLPETTLSTAWVPTIWLVGVTSGG